MPQRICVACVQWRFERVDGFDAWAGRVADAVAVAAGYGARFVVLPEYVSAELLSAESQRLDGPASIARSDAYTAQVQALYRELAKRHALHVIGGSHLHRDAGGVVRNTCFVALADGGLHARHKIHVTPNEQRAWGVAGGDAAGTIEADGVRFAVAICYDSEFPELVRHQVAQGAQLLLVPYCTDDRAGHLRVRYSCAARAIENQIYVAMAGDVGQLRGVHNLDLTYAQSVILTPSDMGFARDGIAVEATPEAATVIVAELDIDALEHARREGTVRNLADRRLDLYRSEWLGK